MKKITRLLTILWLSVIVSTAFAQHKEAKAKRVPKWLSNTGFWVIESNIKTPKSSVINYYNNDNTKIYSEKVEGVKLDISKRKTLMRLKKSLDASLLSWQQTQPTNDTLQVVRTTVKPDKSN